MGQKASTGEGWEMNTTTDQGAGMNNNPTTGELEPFAMEIDDENVLCVKYDDALAALAAEQEKVWILEKDVSRLRDCTHQGAEQIKQLREQLAAERGLRTGDLIRLEKEIGQLREQLAAEREKYQRSQEKVKQYFDQLSAEQKKVQRIEGEFALMYQNELRLSKERAELREQLAAVVEALKWYAVATYPDDGSGRPPEAFQRKAKAALAKIEGK